jgi:uncharacterized protein
VTPQRQARRALDPHELLCWSGSPLIAEPFDALTLDVRIARTFAARCVGLLNRSSLGANEGLLLVPGGSIHTFGMRFAIDSVFLGAGMNVLGVARRVAPWRCVIAPRGTRHVLEIRAGHPLTDRIKVGTVLELFAGERIERETVAATTPRDRG